MEVISVLLDDRLVGLPGAEEGVGVGRLGLGPHQEIGLRRRGFSTHNVPSLSTVAIRSAGYSYPSPGVVDGSTKSKIACFAAQLLQLTRGSVNAVASRNSVLR